MTLDRSDAADASVSFRPSVNFSQLQSASVSFTVKHIPHVWKSVPRDSYAGVHRIGTLCMVTPSSQLRCV